IGVYDTMRDIKSMTAERQDMVKEFGPGSRWYEANKAHPEVIARVDRQVELALSQAAKFHHKRAQELKAMAANTGDQKYGVASLQEYKLAADVYQDYLRRFPSTKEAYELAYYYAECLYFSYEFDRAKTMYAKVRDWPNKKKHLESAAYNVIDSIEKEAAKLAAEGKLRPEDVPGEISDVEEEATPDVEGKVRIEPLGIPPLTVEWMKAVDDYLSMGLQRRSDPDLPARLAYRVANEYYKYRHFDEARKRFEAILGKYPNSLVASYSAVNIINSYRLENDWDNIQVWAKKIEELQIGKPEQRAALQEEVRVFQLGAQFKEAEKLFSAGEYLKAAKAFISVVDKDPKMSFADKALQNAAVAYQREKHFDSAAEVYQRIVSDYPKSTFVEGALLQLAENARKFYDFGRAIDTYRALRARFPDSKDSAYALLTSAILLEAEGRIAEAVKAFEEFSSTYPSDPEAGSVLFKAGKLNQKLGENREALRLYQLFVNEYGSDPKMSEKVVEAISRAADIYRAQGNTREWEKAARAVIREYEQRGLQPDTPVAEYPARAQFMLVEPKFKRYEAIEFTGSVRTQGRKVQQKEKLLRELENDYSLVMPYKAMEWTSAAYYRLARIYEIFADALFKAEIPEMSQEEMDIYQTQIEDAAAGYLDIAQKRYAKLVEQARGLKIANKWTSKAREAMNKYRPQEYPLLKEGRRFLEFDVKAVPPFEESL
ncbi:MAG: tetratricopeptide repeat protein, partial [Deltaproteobacteria bacterium]|nr:tetratricopeptide repeat protein [Deltaproteobacteria bacterium]